MPQAIRDALHLEDAAVDGRTAQLLDHERIGALVEPRAEHDEREAALQASDPVQDEFDGPHVRTHQRERRAKLRLARPPGYASPPTKILSNDVGASGDDESTRRR